MKCIICNEEKYKEEFCSTCYFLIKKFYNIYKEWDFFDIKNYYHNLKHKTYHINRKNIINNNCCKMIALGIILKQKSVDAQYYEKSVYDVKKLVLFKNKIYTDDKQIILEKKNEDLCLADFRQRFPTNIRCQDGHMVRSQQELIVDNWLYNQGIVHAYEKKVVLAQDEIIFCDFYLNKYDVYIEIWGKNDEKYIKRKQIKKHLYNINNLKLIELHPDDLNRLDDNFYIKLKKVINNSIKNKNNL